MVRSDTSELREVSDNHRPSLLAICLYYSWRVGPSLPPGNNREHRSLLLGRLIIARNAHVRPHFNVATWPHKLYYIPRCPAEKLRPRYTLTESSTIQLFRTPDIYDIGRLISFGKLSYHHFVLNIENFN